MNPLAVLLTCFNRKASTIQCLKKLFDLKKDIDVYLVDDNSTDGTYEEVTRQFPQVTLIKGNGNLFWNRGMHLAWTEAAKKDYDYYLWLNDDVILYPNCFEELFDCMKIVDSKGVISGIIESADKKKTLYGGTDKNKKLIYPNGKLNLIRNLNGNVVLVPKYVFNKIGIFDPVYHHDLGDVDYGLRSQRDEIGVFTTRNPIASGEKNSICRERQNHTTLTKRFKKLYSPLGSNPNIIFYYRKKYYGVLNAVLFYVFIHFINIIPDNINQLIFGNKYTSYNR
jgi:GT2 family glycosyltransferase